MARVYNNLSSWVLALSKVAPLRYFSERKTAPVIPRKTSPDTFSADVHFLVVNFVNFATLGVEMKGSKLYI